MVIYKITNTINNKVYIGQTKNSVAYRFNQHFREAKCKKKKNYGRFHDDILKYGKDAFVYQVLEEVENLEDVDNRERYWISCYESTNPNKGYNSDTGGIKGGYKSKKTRDKIGKTTKDKWENPETAAKMREGLRKGTQTAKDKSKILYPFICPICGKTFYFNKKDLYKKKYCSPECSYKSDSWKRGVETARKAIHENNVKQKKIIKDDVVKWVMQNQELVLTCPYNKISTQLSGLMKYIYSIYGIKDIRSIFACFEDVNSRKELLNKLKDIIYVSKENVC